MIVLTWVRSCASVPSDRQPEGSLNFTIVRSGYPEPRTYMPL
jgi:hypothetical protein